MCTTTVYDLTGQFTHLQATTFRIYVTIMTFQEWKEFHPMVPEGGAALHEDTGSHAVSQAVHVHVKALLSPRGHGRYFW